MLRSYQFLLHQLHLTANVRADGIPRTPLLTGFIVTLLAILLLMASWLQPERPESMWIWLSSLDYLVPPVSWFAFLQPPSCKPSKEEKNPALAQEKEAPVLCLPQFATIIRQLLECMAKRAICCNVGEKSINCSKVTVLPAPDICFHTKRTIPLSLPYG